MACGSGDAAIILRVDPPLCIILFLNSISFSQANKKASKGPADLAGLAGRQLGSSSKRTRQQVPSKPSPFKIDPGFYGYHGGDDYGEGPVLSAEYANSVEVSDGDRNSHSSRYPYRYSNPKSSNKRFGSSGRPEFSYDYGDYYDGEGTRKFNAPNHQERDPQYHGLHEDGDDDNQRLHGPDRYNDDLPWESHSDRKGGSGGFRPLARPLDATDDDSEQDKNKNDEGLSIMEMPKMDKFFPIDKSSFIKETSDFAKSHLQEISENFESQLDLGKGQGHGSGSEYDGGETYGHHGGEGVQYEGDYRGYHVGSNGEHEEYHGGYHAFEESDYGLDIGYGGALGSHYSSHGAGARGDRFEQPIFKDTPIYR